MRILTVPLVVFAVLCANLHAQEPAGIPENIIKELDSLVGTWDTEGKVGDKVQKGRFTCRWVRTEDKKKVCLIGHFSHTTEGATRSGVTLIGWNATEKCIEDRGFDAFGGNARLLWTVKSPTEYQGESLMVANGKEVKSKGVLIKRGPSEIVTESETETGEVVRWVFRKVKEEGKKKSEE